jgi:hypothetical protein
MHRLLASVVLAALAGPVTAACYADYRAKQDDPLRLHYGVIELPDAACDPAAAATALRERLGDGWTLLEVESVFGPEGLEDRRESAGAFFLRY